MDFQSALSPDDRFGDLFIEVQRLRIFSDSKTFVDAIPKFSTDIIMEAFHFERSQPDFNLEAFVAEYFFPPVNQSSAYKSDSSKSVDEHIRCLWDVLTRQPVPASNGSLLFLPHAYVVPGDRFREVYYWDSFFSMLGLQVHGRWDLIQNMIDNFSYLIDTIGFIPNGSRTYYLSRSHPPFYSLMVKLLEEKKGAGTLEKYKSRLQKEYDFWMDGANSLSNATPAIRRVVLMPDGSVLNRYWDDSTKPRPESYEEDVELVHTRYSDDIKCRHIRAAAESGWDFSSRWFADGKCMSTINTTDIIPIDLNTLLYYQELVLADAYRECGSLEQAHEYQQRADARKKSLLSFCWNDEQGFFYDYNFVEKQQTKIKSLAALFPLYFKMVEQNDADRVATIVTHDFLKPGGVSTTTTTTDQQWDAPIGWAPLHWITIKGLSNYRHNELANTIRKRWVDLNIQVYERTGKLVEKYNVLNLDAEGCGGEYPVQDGFGWTNGVLLALIHQIKSDPT